ncbi:DUF4921 family protein [Candidatus Woesearchaeota archaeon]|nr:DUF4921 family protein [Candidatus Woesearchaeota archaeon]
MESGHEDKNADAGKKAAIRGAGSGMELRKDYILDRWVYLAAERKKRPVEFKREESGESKTCFFCPGNEALTPPEIGRVSREGSNKEGGRGGNEWLIRWFLNKFPAVEEKSPESAAARTDNTFFTFASAYGRHEIVVDTPNHEEQLWDLEKPHIAELLKVYSGRIDELEKIQGIRYVTVFKNHGREGGTSLVHSHTQAAAISIIPPAVADEANAVKHFSSCPYCRIIDAERKSFRRCFENSGFACFAPYASRFNYEAWIFPKRHVRRFSELDNGEIDALAEVLGKVLEKLKQINAPYNFFLHYAVSGEDLHAHIEVAPRLSIWAGFEFSTGATINSVTPESAAAFYRGEV